MSPSPDPAVAQIIAELNATEQWNLSAPMIAAYAAELSKYLSATMPPATIQRICRNYHADHNVVQALQHAAHPLHSSAWHEWAQRIPAILAQNGFNQNHDLLLHPDDLLQEGLTEIAISLSKFRYASRLNTWSHTVIVNTARRKLRDTLAKKRRHQATQLEQVADLDLPIPDLAHPANVGQARLLAEQITAKLIERANQRLALIFVLYAIHDLTATQIAALVQLHPSCVRALLEQAREILRSDPEIANWFPE